VALYAVIMWLIVFLSLMNPVFTRLTVYTRV